MLAHIGRRALLAVFTVWAISVLSFAIIQLPSGDYVTALHRADGVDGQRGLGGGSPDPRIQYGLGQPIYIQYLKWMKQVVVANFGMSAVDPG